MRVTHDREADAVYVYLSDLPVEDTRIVDDCRFIHFDELGYVRGLELLNVAAGVKISDLPIDVAAVRALLNANHIPVIDVPTFEWRGAGNLNLAASIGAAALDSVHVAQKAFPVTSMPFTAGFIAQVQSIEVTGRADLPGAESTGYVQLSA